MIDNKYQHYFLIIVFISILFFPIVNSQLGLIKDIESAENRTMATLPKPNIKHLDIFPSEFNKYFNDNFSLRSHLIKIYNTFILSAFEKSPIPEQMFFGKDGYLFLGGNELLSFRGKDILSNNELLTFKKEFEYREKYLAKRNCKFYVLIAPNKAAIYYDKVPGNIVRIYKDSWGEQLTHYLEKNSTITTVNLFTAFKKIKDTTPLYYKLDNHWNNLGGYYGVSEFLNKAKENSPMIENTPLSSYNIVKNPTHDGNIVQMLSINQDFLDTTYALTPKLGFKTTEVNIRKYPCIEGFPYCYEYEMRNSYKNTSDITKPKLLIISDSYGGAFYPLASEHFRETVKIFDSWQYKLNEAIVENEKPDIMILIVLESNIRNLLRFTSCPDIKRAE